MSYVEQKYGTGTIRRNYQKTSDEFQVFDILEMQKKEFKNFIDNSIKEVFEEIYPVTSSNKDKLSVRYIKHRISIPRNDTEKINEAKAKGINYSAPLYATFVLENNKDGFVIEEKEAFILNLPIMTNEASFIINGSERIIISQIVRAPGVYFEKLKAARTQTTSESSVYKLSTIIPNRGSWIEFDYKDYALLKIEPSDIKLKIDKYKRLKAMTLFHSFGLSNTEILKLFSNHELIKSSLDKIKKEDTEPENARKLIFKVIRSGDIPSMILINDVISNLLFNKKRYDFSETGRYKLNKKLSPKSRLIDKILAKDLKDAKGNIIYKKGTVLGIKENEIILNYWEKNNLEYTNLNIDDQIFSGVLKDLSIEEQRIFSQVHNISIYGSDKKIINVIAVSKTDYKHLTISDLIATIGYFINLEQGLFNYDDIDSLSNRKIRSINELIKNQLRIGLSKVEKNLKERISAKDTSNVTIKNATNHKLIDATFKEFFNSSQLSQFMDQVNPLSEVSNKRRITSLGPGGLSRDTASLIVRGIHDTHYGRIDPIETPEGPNIGLILNLSIYAKINKYGLIETPYFHVKNGIVDFKSGPSYFIVDDEIGHYIAQGNTLLDKNNKIINKELIARYNGSFVKVPRKQISLIDVSSKQMVSIATSQIPFLENNDANRALMGANMQRQAVPLIKTEAPIVATGAEEIVGKYSPTVLKANFDGKVIEVNSRKIVIKDKNNHKHVQYLRKFERSNQATSINQIPIVKVNQQVKIGDIIADGPSIDNGELSIGKNVLIAFTTWRGYNYEDAIVLSERLVKDDVFTSIHIEEHIIEQRSTKLGDEKITSDILGASKESMRNLGSDGIITIGSEVKVGDVLVGKLTPRGEDDSSPEEKLLDAILGYKNKNDKDSSLRVPYGAEGIVQDVKELSRKKDKIGESGTNLNDGINRIIKVYIAQKRKIKEGDKMSGRHGNKGVVSKILPIEDMPYLADGTPVDVMLNPLGVLSRMNIGQVLEVHLGMAAKKLGIKVATPIFNGVVKEDLKAILKEANIDETGKFDLYDGITGKKFDDKVTVGIMYMLKLSHMVDDKMHSRSIGPYSLITQQPLRGKSQNGGQRFGEMEAWALEAYGAANLLQEMVTLKSDDIKGRNELYNAIAKGKPLPKPNIPEGFWVLYYEIRGLGLDLVFYDEKDNVIEIDNTI